MCPAKARIHGVSVGIAQPQKFSKRIAHMPLSRFSLAFLATMVPALAVAAVPTLQEVNQAFRQGSNGAALDKVNSFLKANPKDAQGRFLKGLILTELNRYADAIKTFSDLTEDYPELPEPYNNLAVLYAAQADFERAKHSLEMAIRTHPSYATAHENLGDIYAKMASQAYDKALQLDSSNTSALTKLSLIKELFSPAPRAAEPVKVADAGKAGKAQPATRNTVNPAQLAKGTAKPEEPARPNVAPTAPIEAAPAPSAAPDRQAASPAASSAPVSNTPGSGAPASSAPTSGAPTPGKPGASTAQKPAAKVSPKVEIEATLKAWVAAWSNRDAEAYLAFYDAAFQTPDGRARDDWAQERKERITRPEFIKVELARMRIEPKGDHARVRFQQHYESNILKDVSWKILNLARGDQGWKIVEER